MEGIKRIECLEDKENQERCTSKIELSFFRHGKYKKDKTRPNIELELTEEAKKQAVEKSKTQNIKQAVAFGSPRARAQEQAGFTMAGKEDEITGKESLAELKEKLDKELKIGSKVGVDRKLDFVLDFNSELGKKYIEHLEQGDFLKFLIKESDELGKKSGNERNFTYSKAAANVASIIDKYFKIAPVWDKLVQDEQKEYTDTMERFFGTHQGNESFLAKVIEKTKGVETRNKFVQALDNQSFDFAEGFNVEILNKGAESPIVHISYKKEKDGKTIFEFDENISQSIIEQIINEK